MQDVLRTSLFLRPGLVGEGEGDGETVGFIAFPVTALNAGRESCWRVRCRLRGLITSVSRSLSWSCRLLREVYGDFEAVEGVEGCEEVGEA